MLLKKSDRLKIRELILISLLTLLGGCGNSAVLEDYLGADPGLKNQTKEVAHQTQDILTTQPNNLKVNGTVNGNSNKTSENRVTANQGASETILGNNSVPNLVLNFTKTFPVYPHAELLEIKSSEDKNSGMMLWGMKDNRQTVADYYLKQLANNNWQVIKPFTINPQQKIARAIAIKDNLRIELSLLPKEDPQSSAHNTRLSVVYHPLDQELPQSSISQWTNSSELEKSFQAKSNLAKIAGQITKNQPVLDNQGKTISKQRTYNSSNLDFVDLDEVPSQLQQPIESVAALNILTPYTQQANVDLTKFAPNEVITRGEYARWLIAANNRYYTDNPGKKIYLATQTNQPAFNDVKTNNPDFDAIQSLAEAGLIPSRLTEDSTNLLFRPDAPLTRADLISWKVPLDTRKSLPQASIQAIEQSWGFQDAADIDSSATRALYADFQNGDRANVRRMFGYTTLFQPKKAVTRAEAAASLWYFGFQGDGITAKEILESEAQTKS